VHWMREGDADDAARYLLARLQPDGGFCGRSAASDLYYTVFGLAGLAALNRPLPEEPVRNFLETFGDGADLDFVHRASAARCWAALSHPSAAGRARGLLRLLETHRSADGGYNHLAAHAALGSVYGGFLAFLAYQEAGDDLPDPESLLDSIRSLRTADGGSANAAGLADGTTTATAAALLLQRWIAGATDNAAVAALRTCECPDGGYLSFARAPGPDLLSTATALYALRTVDRLPADREKHLEFVEALWDDDGGFRGHPADPATDCEYTFYALLALGACRESGSTS
jgi:hypothetical protein